MNKTYEAPEAEIIEMQMPTSLLQVSTTSGTIAPIPDPITIS
jgi:hypothetical protein